MIETQCDMIQTGCSGQPMGNDPTHGHVTPYDCDETVADIRNYSENSGTDIGFGTGADMRPKYFMFPDWIDCYNPSSPNAGVSQSFTATPKPTSQTAPPNWPGIDTSN